MYTHSCKYKVNIKHKLKIRGGWANVNPVSKASYCCPEFVFYILIVSEYKTGTTIGFKKYILLFSIRVYS
jgi:hypothetical protein